MFIPAEVKEHFACLADRTPHHIVTIAGAPSHVEKARDALTTHLNGAMVEPKLVTDDAGKAHLIFGLNAAAICLNAQNAPSAVKTALNKDGIRVECTEGVIPVNPKIAAEQRAAASHRRWLTAAINAG